MEAEADLVPPAALVHAVEDRLLQRGRHHVGTQQPGAPEGALEVVVGGVGGEVCAVGADLDARGVELAAHGLEIRLSGLRRVEVAVPQLHAGEADRGHGRDHAVDVEGAEGVALDPHLDAAEDRGLSFFRGRGARGHAGRRQAQCELPARDQGQGRPPTRRRAKSPRPSVAQSSGVMAASSRKARRRPWSDRGEGPHRRKAHPPGRGDA